MRLGSARLAEGGWKSDAGGAEDLAGNTRGFGTQHEAGSVLFDLDLFDSVDVSGEGRPSEVLALGRETTLELGCPGSCRSGSCWDSAVVESFFGTLKTELIYRRPWPSRRQAGASIAEYLEVLDNRPRRHSYLGFLSPADFEEVHRNAVLAA